MLCWSLVTREYPVTKAPSNQHGERRHLVLHSVFRDIFIIRHRHKEREIEFPRLVSIGFKVRS